MTLHVNTKISLHVWLYDFLFVSGEVLFKRSPSVCFNFAYGFYKECLTWDCKLANFDNF